jgi:hypothetical protein
VKGTSTDAHEIDTNVSSTLVRTWMARNTTASTEMRRWSSCWAKPGHWRALARFVVARPRTIVAVRRTKATIPVARVVYQR